MDFDFMVHLEDLSLAELQQLVDDEDRINQFVMDDERLKKMKLDREMVMAENRSIADDNLGKEPRLKQLKFDLEEKYNRVKKLHDQYQVNRAKIASLGKADNLDSMLAVLQAKSAESEENTEELFEKFGEKEMDIGDFITQFKELRRNSHLRQVKADKMRDLVLEVQRNHVSNPTPYNPSPKPLPRAPQSNHPLPTQAPYPPYPAYGAPPPASHTPYPNPQQSYSQYSW